MNLNMFGEITESQQFTEFHEERIQDLRREVESLDCTVDLMRKMLAMIQAKKGGVYGLPLADFLGLGCESAKSSR